MKLNTVADIIEHDPLGILHKPLTMNEVLYLLGMANKANESLEADIRNMEFHIESLEDELNFFKMTVGR